MTAPRAVARSGTAPYLLWCGVALVACVWFLSLDARHLLRSDEGRYAEIAREMFASGDWVTIRYNGLKYFEKPPLQMWMTALAYQAFGVGEWQARLWVAICGAIGIVATAVAARRWFGARAGFAAALVLLAMPVWNLGSHFNSLDMGVSGALTCVLASVLMAQHPSASAVARRRWMWSAWAWVGVAVLTKGLIGIALPGLVLIVYTAIARDLTLWRRLHLASGLVLMLAITAPWFVLVSWRNPEFAHFFFIHEHWHRYLSTVHGRSGPWWYFVPLGVAGCLPWLGLTAMIAGIVRDGSRAAGFKPVVLLAVWALAIFVFFSVSSSKLPGYLLPVFPALAILAALALERLSATQWRRQLLGAFVLVVAGLVATVFADRFAETPAQIEPYRVFASWLAGACVLALAGIGVAWHLSSRQPQRSVVVYALALFLAATLVLRGHEAFGRKSSGVDLVAPIEAVADASTPIYSVRMLDHTLPFYLRRTTIMVEAADELAFGTAQEPGQWLPTIDAFERRWVSGQRALALMSHETYDAMRGRGLPMVAVAEDERRVVVANFESPPR